MSRAGAWWWRGLRRSESGQALVQAVILLCVFLLLAFGVMGAAVAEGVHIRLRSAADAAAAAASEQADLWERLTVQRHEFACFWDSKAKQWDCYDTWAPPATVKDFYENLWPSGWAVDAGCQYTNDGAAGIPPNPNPAMVCDTWQLQQAGFDFPPGSDPVGAADEYLAENVAGLTGRGVTVDRPEVDLNHVTGCVTVSATATESGNPLGLVLGHPVTVHAQGGAKPRIGQPLQMSGP
jgi:hypothetical protein